MIDAADPGIKLYVRNKRTEDMKQFTSEKTLLFVHGATQPAEATFDLPTRGTVVDGLHRTARLGRVLEWMCAATADQRVRRKWISQPPTILLSSRLMWL